MKKKRYGLRQLALWLCLALLLSGPVSVRAENNAAVLPASDEIQTKISATAVWEMMTVTDPSCASIGGEWTVLGLARSNRITDSYKNTYLANLRLALESCRGELDPVKYTEYSRVTMAVTSLGIDAGNVFGYSMLEKLADYDKVSWQGINGQIFALLALDCGQYAVPEVSVEREKTTRDRLIIGLLQEQSNRGGWGLDRSSAEPDVTAMVLQALAPYRNRTDVNEAVERALSWLSTEQNDDGGFSLNGEATAESCAQVLTALVLLNISPADVRFVKNNSTVLDALLSFGNENGSFSHVRGGEANVMATDQALYAMTAYWRYSKGMKSLYDMTDVFCDSDSGTSGGSNESGSDSEDSGSNTSGADDSGAEMEAGIQDFLKRMEAVSTEPYLSEMQDIVKLQNELETYPAFDGKNEAKIKLSFARKYIDMVQKQVDALDQDIWTAIDPLRLSLNTQEQVNSLWYRYMALREQDRPALQNRQDLEDARSVLSSLTEGVIPARVFENQLATGESFTYEGKAGAYSYSMTFQATDIHTAGDMDAGVSLDNSAGAKLPEGAFGFRLEQSGTLAGKMTFAMTGGTAACTYTLYHMNSATGKWSSLGNITVDSQNEFSCTLSTGGDYCLVPVQEAKKTSQTNKKTSSASSVGKKAKTVEISNMVEASAADGVIPASEFKKIKGEDKNLTYTCEAKDSSLKSKAGEPVAYTLIFNGQDVENFRDFAVEVTSEPEDKEKAELLAENPWILSFAQTDFPGEMLFSSENGMEDGEYLLCRYNAEEEKAELVRKVTIKEGVFQTVFARGGTYFLAKRVSTKTVSQLQQEEDTTAEEETETEEETVSENAGEDPEVLPAAEEAAADETVQKTVSPVFWVILGMLCVLGLEAGLFALWKVKKGGAK